MDDITEVSRETHLNWCKQRALEYIEAGDIRNGLLSMFSDLEKHPETKGHGAISLGLMLMMTGSLSTKEEAKSFIEGFN